MSIFSKFFPSKTKAADGSIVETDAITLTPVWRKRGMTEEQRKSYATELLDTYYGFGSTYLAGHIRNSIKNHNIRAEMTKIVRCLPLLKFFVNSISRVYATQPTRKFYFEGKEIIKEIKKQDSKNIFKKENNNDKFYQNSELYEALNNMYNDNILVAIKQAERFTNLLNACVFKVITNDDGLLDIVFISNDTVQIKPSNNKANTAEQIAFIQDTTSFVNNRTILVPIVETWSKNEKSLKINNVEQQIGDDDKINQAALEYEALFGTKTAGYAFAPFVVFRDNGIATDFWDLKDNDIISYIKSINMSLTELKYLEKFCSFGLKYGINIKMPDDGVIDPVGFMDLSVKNNGIPGDNLGKNFEIGEFKNEGRIDEVIKSIIFNVKMLFSMYNIPLDALISTNSVRSAENKQLDNDELFATINAQRDIWNNNEQTLFKVMQAVHNRDNAFQIPKGIELIINFDEKKSTGKTADDWLIEIQNNISTAIDWLSEINPDLDRDELMALFKSNETINDSYKSEILDLNQFKNENDSTNIPNNATNNSNSDNSSQS